MIEKRPNWRRILRKQQTQVLIGGLTLGYCLYIALLGWRLIAIVSGGAIALVTFTIWLILLNQICQQQATNLLEPETFGAQLEQITKKLTPSSAHQWQPIFNWARQTQILAQSILSKEPELLPELLETLHTVLALSDRTTETILALGKMQTDTYRHLTAQHLEAIHTRLRETHGQIQQLHDQIVVSNLDAGVLEIPRHLQLLIAENKTALESFTQPK